MAKSQLYSELENTNAFDFPVARSRWMKFGDRNTKLFHCSTIVRRRKNFFHCLENEDHTWSYDQKEMEEKARNYFVDLFGHNLSTLPYVLRGCFPEIPGEHLQLLGGDISNQEVRNALFSMGSYKAPGEDGFQAIFFKAQWHIVGDALCKTIIDAYNDPERIVDINNTLIALVPKLENATRLSQFRPISLCTVTYKILTKILAHRLRGVMELLVSPMQSSFVPNRSSRDNIIVAQEIFHSMKYKKGRVGWMAIKLDLAKAYDKLDWGFVIDTLTDIGLPTKFVNVINCCLSTSSMKVLWNGEASEAFKPLRGIRQGDPISPYLFVLYLERLSQLIEVMVHNGAWKPVKLSAHGPSISHLAFADDVILFTEANLQQAQVISACLDKFCCSSGQTVSREKTRIFFSKNVGREVRHQLSSELGFSMTSNIGKYLGVNIYHDRVTRNVFRHVMEKASNRLSTWKSRILSIAGRTTLIKSVLAALPAYVMQSTKLPRTVCDDIDKMSRSFLWGDHDGSKHLHAVRWDTICTPKVVGGLGIRKSRAVNDAYLFKLCWELSNHQDKLWVRILRGKYKCLSGTIPDVTIPQHASNLWRGIGSVWNVFMQAVSWRLGNGNTIKFWRDAWVPGERSLQSLALVQLSESDLNMRVVDMLQTNGDWNGDMLRGLVPVNIVVKILSLPTPSVNSQQDSIFWEHSSNGIFSIKSAYQFITTSLQCEKDPLFVCIWKWPGPERTRCFLWKAAHNVLTTNALRHHRGMTINASCPLCNLYSEDQIHIFRDCRFSFCFWRNRVPTSIHSLFWTLNWKDWLLLNLNFKRPAARPWHVTFGFTLQLLWKRRNMLVFHNTWESDHAVWRQANCLRITLESALNSVFHISRFGNDHVKGNQSWVPPPEGVIKLNCDGALSVYNLKAAAGGLLRDHEGTFIMGFVYSLEGCSVVQTELWAVLHGLSVAVERGVKHLMVESDSLDAVTLLNQSCHPLHPCSQLVQRILLLGAQVDSCTYRYIPREANEAADVLAKFGLSLNVNCKIFDTEPPFLSSALLADFAASLVRP